MIRRIVTVLILLPLALVIVLFAVGNRAAVTLAFDPFAAEPPMFSASLPLFLALLIALILGVIVGGAAAWARQRKWRRRARRLAADLKAAQATALAWRCARPLATALVITGAFQPPWAAALALGPAPPWAARVAASFGGLARLPRSRQLWRKYEHFDSPWDALRYTWAQGRRHARERFERQVRRRSPRERLGLAPARRP